MDCVYLYILTILAAMMVFYVFARTIDYLYTRKDDERRYRMVKGTIKYGCKKVSGMSVDMVKQINQGLFDMAKNFEGQ